jgi:hypothetical protein
MSLEKTSAFAETSWAMAAFSTMYRWYSEPMPAITLPR